MLVRTWVLHDTYERYCDAMAAEFLVPAHVLRETWNHDIKKQSRQFKVSEIVVARRAHDLGLIERSGLSEFLDGIQSSSYS